MPYLNHFTRKIRGVVREPARRGEPAELLRIRQLDPRNRCGESTTVMQLFRVEDLPEDASRVHMVFHDRHGWYCEHGRECPAVDAVRRHQRGEASDR